MPRPTPLPSGMPWFGDKKTAFKLVSTLMTKKNPVEMVLGGLNWKLSSTRQMDLPMAQLMHETDVATKLGQPHTIEHFMIEFFALKNKAKT